MGPGEEPHGDPGGPRPTSPPSRSPRPSSPTRPRISSFGDQRAAIAAAAELAGVDQAEDPRTRRPARPPAAIAAASSPRRSPASTWSPTSTSSAAAAKLAAAGIAGPEDLELGAIGADARELALVAAAIGGDARARSALIQSLMAPTGEIPSGTRYLDFVLSEAAQCERQSRQLTVELSDALGALLWVMDAASSCMWGCLGGNHAVEHLVGRCCGYAVAALKLAESGFYDESLSLTRTIGEAANLLYLFAIEPSAREKWITLNEDTAWKTFSPAKVRQALEQKGKHAPIDKQRYGTLCAKATHPTPNIPPQMYNEGRVPMAGGKFQEAGLFVCLAELGLAVSIVAGCTVLTVKVPRDQAERAFHAGEVLKVKVAEARDKVNRFFPGTYKG